MRLGLIAGNGRFPFLVLDAARAAGHDVTVIAAKEETFPELNDAAKRTGSEIHWISLGQLGTCIALLKSAGVTHAVMAGQVKHAKIFSGITPDWTLAKLLDPFGLTAISELAKSWTPLEKSTRLVGPQLAIVVAVQHIVRTFRAGLTGHERPDVLAVDLAISWDLRADELGHGWKDVDRGREVTALCAGRDLAGPTHDALRLS